MRVKEVLHERRIIQENLMALNVALRIARGMGAGLTAEAKQALTMFTARVAGKATAAEELAKGWLTTTKVLKVAPEEALEAGLAAARSARVAPEVLVEAEKAFAKLVGRSVLLRFRSATSAAEWYYASTMWVINKVLIVVGIYQPIAECIYYIHEAYVKNEEGHPEYQGNKLQFIVQFEVQKAIRAVTAIIIGKGAIGWILGPKGIQVLGPLGWGPIGKAFNMLTPAAQATFMAWFQTPAGQEYFAQWLVGKALVPGTDWTMPGGGAFKLLTQYAAGFAKTGYDAILRQMGSDKAGKPPAMPDDNKWKSSFNLDLKTGTSTIEPKSD